ncbi:MAG: ATP-binding protein [Gemmatimonadaceae bacterium]|nr:ATP-binding protein [Gemmatimonadaceae bacterium]
MSTTGRRTAERIVWGYIVLWCVALVIVPRPSVLAVVVDASYFALGAVVLGTEWRLSRHPSASRDERRAWQWLSAGSAVSWLTGVWWTIALSRGDDTTLVDALHLLSPWLWTIGVLQFRRGRALSWRDYRARLDVALFVIAMLAICWQFTIRPALLRPEPMSATSVMAAVGEWVRLTGLAVAYVRAAGEGRRAWIALLLASGVLDAISSYAFDANAGIYLPGHWVDLLFFASWVFEWRSAARARSLLEPADANAAPTPRRATASLFLPLTAPRLSPARPVRYPSGIAPSVFVGASYVLLIISAGREGSADALPIAIASAAMTVLLLVRQRVEIAENRQLTRDLALSASRFRAVVERARDVIIVVAPDGRTRYASPSGAEAGIGAPDVDFASYLAEYDGARFKQWLEQLGPEAGSLRVTIPRADGSARTFDLRGQDRRHDPDVQGWVVTARDLTDELQLEARLRHSQKLHAVSEMAGRVAHAYNNALAAVRGYADLIAEDLDPTHPGAGDVANIQAAADRGAAITRQLLGFSGTSVGRRESLDARDIAVGLTPMLAPLLPPSITLTVDVPDGPLPFVADRAQVEQVVTNLVTNARDAMPEGGAITIRWRAGVAGDAPGCVVLEVQDTGAGIPSDVLAQIFTPFFTTKAPGRGTGLGLAMVDAIVRRSGGTVRASSVVGVGTTMRVELPRHDAVATGSTLDRPTEPPAAARAIVLLVDDEDDVRRVAQRMLERGGYAVIDVPSGAEAIIIAEDPSRVFDVVVTDLMMPVVSGRDVVEALQRTRAEVPVVCITGYASASVGGASLAEMVHAVVEKPFSSAQLLDAVGSALRRGRAEEPRRRDRDRG